MEQIPDWIPRVWQAPERLIGLLSRVPERPIFHYTSKAGLLGILKEKAIWATNVLYLNDSAEFRYTLDLVEKRLKEQETDPDLKVFNHFRENVVGWLRGSMQYPSFFVSSFSERGDLLSQWRAYCPEGIGFSIGFSYDQLLPALKKEQPNARLVKCIYNEEEQIQIVDELLARALTQVNKDHLEESSRLVAGLLINDVSNLAVTFKHPAFAEEAEWRVVVGSYVSVWRDLCFRPGKSMLIPYCSFEICETDQRLQIQNMYVGPNPHGLLSSLAVINSLTRHNAHSVEGVTQSAIPYRSW